MKLGGLDISTVKLGASQVQAIYQGPNLVWQNAPVATAATGVGQTSFTANWNAYTGAVVYLLDVSASPSFDALIYENQQVNAPSTSYVVIGLEPNTTYYYRVRASTEALTDPDAQAFFDRVTAAEGTLSALEQLAVNQLVLDMKADGIWTKMKAIYPMVGASAAACAQNLKSSSFTGTFTATGWTFASTGVKGLNSGVFMNTNLSIDSTDSIDTSLGCYIRTNNGNSFGSIIALNDTVNSVAYYLAPKWTGAGNIPFTRIGAAGADVLTAPANQLPGFFQSSRTSNSFISFRRNNSSLATNTATVSSIATSLNIFVNSENRNGSAFFNTGTSDEISLIYIGNGITDLQMDNYYTAVQAFQTTLGRAIAP